MYDKLIVLLTWVIVFSVCYNCWITVSLVLSFYAHTKSGWHGIHW